jgi:small conductance mechanosensitive channel
MESLIPEVVKPYFPMIKGAVIALLILLAGRVVSDWTGRLTRRGFAARRLDEALGRFVANVLRYAVLAAAIIAALGAVGIPTTSMLAIFASAGLAVGLALKDSLGSFASGVMVLLFRPFTLGDRVTLAGQAGVVEDIGLFATTLLTPNNETIIVPNRSVTGASIVNHSAQGKLRGQVVVSVADDSDIAAVMRVLQGAAARAQLVIDDPAPAVALTGLPARGYEFTVHAWSSPASHVDMIHHVRRAVVEDLRAAGISGPPNELTVVKKE